MKILVAPLNWGLGHASRCVPLIRQFLDEGHEVILAGDGESLVLLRRHFPTLRYTYLAPLNLRYSAGKSQVGAIVRALPKLVVWAMRDHAQLRSLLREEHIDRVVSDNRFGLYSDQTECIYMTHQLHIFLPKGWRWAEGIAARLHARIYTRYNKVWVPDYEQREQSLAGEMSHPSSLRGVNDKIAYIGPQSRFSGMHPKPDTRYDVVAVLSGLEPQRTLLEQQIVARFQHADAQVLIVQGLMKRPHTSIKRSNITIVPSMSDEQLVPLLLGAKEVIARSGYSTIMDLQALGILDKSTLIPTPGQSEQAYLSGLFAQKNAKKC